MEGIERDICVDLQHYRAELHELTRRLVQDSNSHARVLHLQRRITWCEGWLRVLGVSPPKVAHVWSTPASPLARATKTTAGTLAANA